MRFPWMLAVASLALAAGCGDDSNGGGGGGSGGGEQEACPTMAGPTEHAGERIEADAVWTAADSPHVVTGDVLVGQGATLTIEPCAEVVFAADASIQVGHLDSEAHLVAEGDAQRPIALRGQDGATWGGIWVQETATARLAHVTIENTGAVKTFGNEGAAILVKGENVEGLRPLLHVEHVTIEDAAGPGVILVGDAAFSDDSVGLHVSGAGSENVPFPVVAPPDAASTIPAGSYTGNRTDAIAIRGDRDVRSAIEWANHGVPYRLIGIPGSYVRIASETDADATLALGPGVVFEFDPGTFLWIGSGTAAAPAAGAIRAVGTPAEPVVFTSAAEVPNAGDWVGLTFRGVEVSPNNQIEYAVIEYAGGDCSCGGLSCATEAEAAVIFMDVAPADPFIRNTTIRHSAGHGINRGWSQRDAPGVDTTFLEDNEFEEIGGCRETMYRDELNGCEEPPPCP